MPDTVIARVNALGQGKPNDIDFLDRKKRPIVELDITVVDAGVNQDPQIELIEPDNDLDHILFGAETLPELLERQDITTFDIEKKIGIAKEDGTLEAENQRIGPPVPSLAGGELPMTIYFYKIDTPEETPGVRISCRVILETKPGYIPSMPCKKYKTVNTVLECEETLHPDDHMFS